VAWGCGSSRSDKCIRWAGTAKSEHERDFFLKIARTWLDAALRVESTLAIIDEHAEKAEITKK
jgi:hypothetical protein